MKLINISKHVALKLLSTLRVVRRGRRLVPDENDSFSVLTRYLSGDYKSLDIAAEDGGFSRDSLKTASTRFMSSLDLEFRKIIIPKGAENEVKEALDQILLKHVESLNKGKD